MYGKASRVICKRRVTEATYSRKRLQKEGFEGYGTAWYTRGMIYYHIWTKVLYMERLWHGRREGVG